MRIRPVQYILVFLISFFWSCTGKKVQDKSIVLVPGYQQIQDIVSIAQCSSPFGKYTTEVHSFADGGCYFKQTFNDNDAPFIIRLDSHNAGYLVAENDSIITTLLPEDVEMIRGHEFHRMHMNPQRFYANIHFEKNETLGENEFDWYLGEDRLDNPVKILYDTKQKLISKIELINPKDTAQTIEINYNKWVDSKYGKLASKIYIVQAKKDTFFFDFQSLKVKDTVGFTTII